MKASHVKMALPGFLLVSALLAAGCSGSGAGGSSNGTPVGNATGVSVDSSGAVDISGFVGLDNGGSEVGAPCYWRNGAATTISSTQKDTVWVNWTAVDGSKNLYIAGGEGSSGSTPTPVYWENGALTHLPMTSGDTYGLALGALIDSSNNVSFTGSEGTSSTSVVPCYWENGSLVPLSLSSGSTTYGYGVAVSAAVDTSGTLYIAGEVGASGSGAQSPCYWIVGGTSQTLVVLAFNSGNSYGTARNIAIDASDTVYVSGVEGPSSESFSPCYWSGTTSTISTAKPTDLSLGTGYSSFYLEWAGLLSASTTDSFYIVGSVGTSGSNQVPAYWDISGTTPTLTPTLLPMGSAGVSGSASGVAFDSASPPNVYIAGTIESSSGSPTPVYWENNVEQGLSTALSASAAEVRDPTPTSRRSALVGGADVSSH